MSRKLIKSQRIELFASLLFRDTQVQQRNKHPDNTKIYQKRPKENDEVSGVGHLDLRRDRDKQRRTDCNSRTSGGIERSTLEGDILPTPIVPLRSYLKFLGTTEIPSHLECRNPNVFTGVS